MFKRRRNVKLKAGKAFADSTRRRISRKVAGKRLLSRWLKQTPLRLEEQD